MAIYRYGMRIRGFSIGCQPKEGFYKREDSNTYHDIISYTRPLTPEEIEQFSLDFIGTAEVDA